MALAPRNPQIPGTSKITLCRQPRLDGKPGKCNLTGNNIIEGKIELFGREVPVKVPLCNKHFEIVQEENLKYLRINKESNND